MSKKTILKLSKKHKLIQDTVDSGHYRPPRVSDISVSPDGTVITPPPTASFDLKEAHTVSRVSVDRDADGNVFITLEE